MADTPERAQIIVVGGGVVGTSIAYHLTKLGIKDVLLLERHELTGGTTWHAAGLVAQLRSTENLTRLAQYTLELYQQLEQETGQATGFRAPGAISLAPNPQRWEELRRTAAMARYLGVVAEEIGPKEVAEKFPLCDVSDIIGGIWLPDDGTVGPSDVTMALAKGARTGGAKILEGTGVADVIVDNGRCVGVPMDPTPSGKSGRTRAFDGSRTSLRRDRTGRGLQPRLANSARPATVGVPKARSGWRNARRLVRAGRSTVASGWGSSD